MALNNLGLGLVFTATDRASAVVDRLAGRMGSLDERASHASETLRRGFGAAAGAALGAGAISLARAAGSFEIGIRRVANISGATTEQLKELRATAIKAGLETKFSPTESIRGLEALSALGFDAAASQNVLWPALDLAAGGMISIEQAATTAGSAIRAFSLQGKDITTVADKLLQAGNQSALQANELAIGIGTVARGASLTKQSLDEMLISMGVVRDTGVGVEVAASSVSSALVFAAQRAKQFGEIGVQVSDDAGFRKFLDIVLDTSRALDKRYTDAAKRAAAVTERFGKFGTTAFVATETRLKEMVKQNPEIHTMADAVEVLREQMAAAGDKGIARKFRDNINETFEGATVIMKGALQTLAVVAGEPLARVLKPVVQDVTAGVIRLVNAIQALPAPLLDVIAKGVLITSTLVALGGSLAVVRAGFSLLAPAIRVATVSMATSLIGMAPLVLALGAIATAAVGAAVVFRRDVGGIGSVATDVGEGVLAAAQGMVRWLRTLTAAAREFGGGIREGFLASLDAVRPAFSRMRTGIAMLAMQFGLLNRRVDSTGRAIEMRGAVAAGRTVGSVLAGIAGFVADAFGAVAQVWAGFVAGVKGAVFVFRGAFASFRNAVAEFGNEFGGALAQLGAGMGKTENQVTSLAGIGSLIGQAFGLAVVAGTQLAAALTRVATTVLRVFRAIEPVVSPLVKLLGTGLAPVLGAMLGARLLKGVANVSGLTTALGRLATTFGRVGTSATVAAAGVTKVGSAAQVATARAGSRTAQSPLDILHGPDTPRQSAKWAAFHQDLELQQLKNRMSPAAAPSRFSRFRAAAGQRIVGFGRQAAGAAASFARSPQALGMAGLAASFGNLAMGGNRVASEMFSLAAVLPHPALQFAALAAGAAEATGVFDKLAKNLIGKGLESGPDHTGVASRFDPTGEADAARKFARQHAIDVQRSQENLRYLFEASADGVAFSARIQTEMLQAFGSVERARFLISGLIADVIPQSTIDAVRERGEGVGMGIEILSAGMARALENVNEAGRLITREQIEAFQGQVGTVLGGAEAERMAGILMRARGGVADAPMGAEREALEALMRNMGTGSFTFSNAIVSPKDIEAFQAREREGMREALAINFSQRVAQAENFERALTNELPQAFRDATLAATEEEAKMLAKLMSEQLSRVINRPVVITLNGEEIITAIQGGTRNRDALGYQGVPPDEAGD